MAQTEPTGTRKRERTARRELERHHLRLRKSRKAGAGYYITDHAGRPILPDRWVAWGDPGPGVTLEAVETYLAELPAKDYSEIRAHLPQTFGVDVTGYHPDIGPLGDIIANIADDLPQQVAETLAAELSEALPSRGDIRVVWLDEDFGVYEVRIGDDVVYSVTNA